MSKPIVYTWPAADSSAICLLQSTAGASNLVINGTLSAHYNSDLFPSVRFDKISRNISITSANNLSAVNFTITGTYRGNVISETISGPGGANPNPRITVNVFDSVTAVSVSGAAAAFSVGSSNRGYTHWFSSNYNGIYPALSVQVVVSGGVGNITYSFETTLDDVEKNSNPFVENAIAGMILEATSKLEPYFNPALYSRIRIEGTTTTGSLVATFLRQGII